MGTSGSGKAYHLFGYPVAHSASPTLQNACFDALGTGNQFSIWSTSKVTKEMMEVIRGDGLGGAAVTMPLKAAIIPFLDEISAESKITDACNTIVKVPRQGGGFKLVGTNTDILGVRNALLNAARSQHPSAASSFPPNVGAGLVIGGGATTRSAAHALSILGLSPIYLINRDPAEVRHVCEAMAHLDFVHLQTPDDVEKHVLKGKGILMAVGAIPAIKPVTYEERMVYTTIMAVLTTPYSPSSTSPVYTEFMPLPTTRIFLEMPYKPRRTPMLQIAEAMGWHVLGGVQAMIEQGLAQQRMWLMNDFTVEAGSAPGVLRRDIEEAATKVAEEMGDVVVHGTEVDRSDGKEVVVNK